LTSVGSTLSRKLLLDTWAVVALVNMVVALLKSVAEIARPFFTLPLLPKEFVFCDAP
jgi:hypothetical protein